MAILDTLPFEDERAVIRLEIDKKWTKSIITGLDNICQFISNLLERELKHDKRAYLLAIDGYLGVDWLTIIPRLEKQLKERGFEVKLTNVSSCYRSPKEIEKIVNPYIIWDPLFGKLWIDGSLEHFFDPNSIDELKRELMKYRHEEKLENSRTVVICFGCGASYESITNLYDCIFYIDITRQELLRRVRKKSVKNLGVDEVLYDDSAYVLRRLYYIDFPVLDKHKKYTMSRIDYYVDCNNTKDPKLIPKDVYEKILSTLAEYPIRLKPIYIPGVWGGQWLKRIRNLPKSKVNVSWSFELVPYEQSILIDLNKIILDIPFLNLLWKEPAKIVGNYSSHKFNYDSYFETYFFPISFNYDDTIDGSNMSIQVHPHHPYTKEKFNEPYSHDESYYIVAVAPGSFVHFGLKDGIDKDEFYRLAERAEKKRIPFDYTNYVNRVPTKPGDYFLIPAGTVHGSGRNEVVLEIDSSCCAELTCKIYDYLRPDLSGKLRPISLHHAFKAIKFYRTASWVLRHLKQQPKLVRTVDDGAEYVIGELEELFFVTHRLEFKKQIDDDTEGKFHILTLVEGDSIFISSQKHAEKNFKLKFTETILIPACFGKYQIMNLGSKSCKVVKALLK